jgi:hypothetical protein
LDWKGNGILGWQLHGGRTCGELLLLGNCLLLEELERVGRLHLGGGQEASWRSRLLWKGKESVWGEMLEKHWV